MFKTSLINKKNIPSLINIYGDLEEVETMISTDSRMSQKSEIFVAIDGENIDGHNFIPSLLNSELLAVVYNCNKYSEKEIIQFQEKSKSPLAFISCTNTIDFLQELAKSRMIQWKKLNSDNLVIGITGSNAKTTNKEMLYFLLDSILKNKILCTKGNLNNHLGVPFTIFDLRDIHKVAIIEMGSNHLGEIEKLCDIALPDAGLITNIGQAHIEFFKNENNIFKEKSSLYDSVLKTSSGNGIFIANSEDKFLKKLRPSKGLLFFGEGSRLPYALTENCFEINNLDNNEIISVNNKFISEEYNLVNLIQALLLAISLFPSYKNELVANASKFKLPANNRSEWINDSNFKIFLDAYNANPSSMLVSIKSFINTIKRKNIPLSQCLFVLGDMNELGEKSKDEHKKIGSYLLEHGAINTIAVGKFHASYKEGFLPSIAKTYESREELEEDWCQLTKNIQYIFIKGSRSLELEKLVR